MAGATFNRIGLTINSKKSVGYTKSDDCFDPPNNWISKKVDEKKNGELSSCCTIHWRTHRCTRTYTLIRTPSHADVYFIHQISIPSLDKSQCSVTFEVCHRHNLYFFFFFYWSESYICTRINRIRSINRYCHFHHYCCCKFYLSHNHSYVFIAIVEHFECHTLIELDKIEKSHSRHTGNNWLIRVNPKLHWRKMNWDLKDDSFL